MSTKRSRPTREETCERLLDSAACLFAERGVLGTTIDEVVARAGLTRGAFYSNFRDRDELASLVAEHKVTETIARNLRILTEHEDPEKFAAALAEAFVEDGTVPLHIELMLHALRSPEQRVRYAEAMRRLREGLEPVVERALRNAGVIGPIDAKRIITILLALEDGLTLHGLIDPDHIPRTAYFDVLAELQELFVLRDRTSRAADT